MSDKKREVPPGVHGVSEPENTDPSKKGTITEPVMDGATETFDPDDNPRKGQDDPQLVRDPEKGEKTTKPYS